MTDLPQLALRDTPDSTGFGRAPSGEGDVALGGRDTRFVCQKCRTRISDASKVFSPAGGSPVRVFTNPDGRVCQVITLLAAESLVLVGPPTSHYTWFVGYVWRVALCARCLSHLGWRYEAAQAGTLPADFFGLLVTELAEELE